MCRVSPAGKSNSGEGGEDPSRWLHLEDVDGQGRSPAVPYLRGLRNGDTATSKIKQARQGAARVSLLLLLLL
jgi:glutamate synthase (ferredoxin)